MVSTETTSQPSARFGTRSSARGSIILATVALVGGLLLAGCAGSTGASARVDATTFLRAAGEPGVTVIDVRTPAEFASGHLQGAVNIDIESADFATRIAALDEDGTYAVYCRSGRRSSIAADALLGAGFAHVQDLAGGLADLQAGGGSIVTS